MLSPRSQFCRFAWPQPSETEPPEFPSFQDENTELPPHLLSQTRPSLHSAMKIQLKLLDDNSPRVHPLFIFLWRFPFFKVFFISVTQYYKMIKTFVSLFLALLCKGSPSGPNAHRRLGFPFPFATIPANITRQAKVCAVFFFATVQKCESGCALLLSAKHAIFVQTTSVFWGNFHLCAVGGRERGACQTRGLYNLAA